MKYTKQIDDYYSTRIIKSIFKIAWVIVGTTTNIIWWSFSKLPKSISLLLIPLGVIFASGVVTPVVSNEEAVIIYDIPTPTEQRLKDLEGKDWSKEDISWYISVMATKYNVSEDTMHAIVKGESQYNDMTRDGDMSITCARTGLPVRARGLVQITECWFPDITDEEARSVPFALEFLAKNMSEGLGVMLWSTHPNRV